MTEKSQPPSATAAEVSALENRAARFRQAGRLAEALDVCRRILALQPERADALLFAGTVAFELGEHAEAAELYAQAVALAPELAGAHYNHANALKALGRWEDAAAAYRRATDIRPQLAAAHHNLGTVLQALDRLEDAAAAYRRALAIAPRAAASQRNLGLALQGLGRPDEAADAYRAALRLRPDWALVYSNLVSALTAAGDWPGVAEVCQDWLRLVPGDTEAMAMRALALNETGAAAEAGRLLDFDRFVRTVRHAAPAGFADLRAFNAALAAHVTAHPTLKVPPADDPTYHHPKLQITEELLVEPKGPVATLEAMIRSAIEGYRGGVATAPAHPFIENWPARWRLTAWSIVLNGGGNLVPHIHLDGYLGGVYYVELPEVVADEAAGRAGWFELGRPPDDLACTAAPRLDFVRPEEGLMILFPSYIYHRTVPYDSGERRISIAFDIVPEG